MFLLDTNVVSELRKLHSARIDINVARWADSVEAGSLYLSVITVEELERGILSKERKDIAQGNLLRTWFEHHVLPAFFGRILPIDLAVARKSAALHVPNPRPFRDTFIAATALVHGMTVVTRNLTDFQALDLKLINPWDDLPSSL